MPDQVDLNRRFQVALERSQAEWAAADPARAAALAGCTPVERGVRVPYFGGPHVVTHPAGEAFFEPTGRPAHPSIAILLIHYLVTADGTPPADRWSSFRDLPDGMFYAQAFAAHAETPLAEKLGARLDAFRTAARALGGTPVDLADASFRFVALPRLPMAVLLWEGDEEFPARARILFDAHARHYLPAEDLSGIGDWLAHRLTRCTSSRRPPVGLERCLQPAYASSLPVTRFRCKTPRSLVPRRRRYGHTLHSRTPYRVPGRGCTNRPGSRPGLRDRDRCSAGEALCYRVAHQLLLADRPGSEPANESGR